MSPDDRPETPDSESWDNYWAGSGEQNAYHSDGASHPGITEFWEAFFKHVRQRIDSPFCIDLASGSGAVLAAARESYGGTLPNFLCVDVSGPALDAVKRRFPEADVLCADAGHVPLATSSCDVVTSQYGIEYAGRRAIAEMARLVGDDGHFGAVLHHRGGVLFEASTRNLDAVDRLTECRFLPRAKWLFETGFDAARGGQRGPYEAAATDFAPAIVAVDGILADHGPDVASGLIARLYDDVATIHERLTSYQPREVLLWLERMQNEVAAYRNRTEAMLDAALDADDFARVVGVLKARGFEVRTADTLQDPDGELPIAWSVHAVRQPAK